MVGKSQVFSLLRGLVVAHDSPSQMIVGTKDQFSVSINGKAFINPSKYLHQFIFPLNWGLHCHHLVNGPRDLIYPEYIKRALHITYLYANLVG